MQAEPAPEMIVGSLNQPDNNFGISSKYGNCSDPKPKMNIALDGSTYTKTIDLKPQDFYKLPTFDDFGTGYNCSYSQPTPRTSVIQNGQVSHSLNESNEPSISPTTTSNNLIGLSFFSSWTKPRTSSRPTFFSRFARRLTIRRTYSKPPSAIPSSSNANSSMPQCQVPTGLKIRRWLSKHLIPPQKNSPCKPLPEAFSTRAATFDGAIDKRISQPTEDFGSVPIQRRGLPQPNLSESSLCNSQAGTLSLGDDPHEVNGIVLHQGSCSYEKERLISACASGPQQDNRISQLSSAFSSPSVTAIGPPPRYLNVSLAAFGYTCCNRKWVSAQTLEHGKTPVGGAREPNPIPEGNTNTTFAFFGATVTPQRHKSTSPAPISRTDPVQRPYHLDLRDGCNAPVASSTPRNTSRAVSPVSTAGDENSVSNANNNSSGVTIRVKRNVSNGNSSQLAFGAESDQPQDLSRSNHSHHEHWNRSSLIMLAVAQASPRSHNTPSTTSAATSNPPSTIGGRFSFTESAGSTAAGVISASPSKTFSGRRPTLSDAGANADAGLPKVDEVPSTNTTDSSHAENEEAAASLSTAATNGHAESHEDAKFTESQEEVVKDGYFFLRQAEETTQELRSRVEEIERDLEENELSEEVSGHLRTTVGKVNLLLSQKFVQFRGLCANCIEAAERASVEGELVTLPSDLEGFWAMVMLQVDDLRSMIASCDRLRQSGWKLDPGAAITVNGTSNNQSTPAPTKRRQPRALSATPAKDKEAAALARNQARERLRAAKRQYMRARMEELAANGSLNSDGNVSGSVLESGDSSTFLVL